MSPFTCPLASSIGTATGGVKTALLRAVVRARIVAFLTGSWHEGNGSDTPNLFGRGGCHVEWDDSLGPFF